MSRPPFFVAGHSTTKCHTDSGHPRVQSLVSYSGGSVSVTASPWFEGTTHLLHEGLGLVNLAGGLFLLFACISSLVNVIIFFIL